METLFGKGRWVYWAGMSALVAGVVVVINLRGSPEEIGHRKMTWGDAAFAAGKYDKAVIFYDRALEKDPTLLPARFNRALAYENLDERKAVAAWDDYLRRAKGDPAQAEWVATAGEHRARLTAMPYLRKAAALAAGGDRKGAAAAYARALTYYPANLEGLTDAAANEAAAGNYEAAAGYYERALGVAPYSMNTKYKLAQVYEHFDKGKAATQWKEILDMAKTRPDLTTEKVKEAQRRSAALRAEGYDG